MISQPLQALSVANEVKQSRCALKREVKASDPAAARRHVADVILDPPHWAGNWQLADVLCILPRFGTTRAASICHQAHTSTTRRLCDLTDRQRTVIALALSNSTN
ncbi:MAG: hypothetical protein WCO96_01315 [Actinomycetes bacterium]